MASSQALPEPMNSSPHHSKVKVTITLPDPTFVAGAHVSGKLEMECRADRGLGIGIMMVELFAIEELTSRDHSATSTFLHSCRLFQGPGLPPSNAVQAHPMPGDPHLPQHYHQARRGRSTFLFRIPIPASSPSSISFGSGLAKVRYELRASVGVYWKNEKRLVIDKRSIDVVESYPYHQVSLGDVPESIVVGENGKLWMQGRIVGGVIVAGESACLELQVKNHSNKKNSGLTLTLTRTLYLAASATGQQLPAPVQISDTLTTVPFRGPEYIIPPGAEGIANLVFDVPKDARGVRGGILDGEEVEGGSGPRHSESLFEIKCKVEVKLTMGMGSKDTLLEVPVEIVHPKALPTPQHAPGPYAQAYSPQEPVHNPTSLNSAPYVEYNPYYPPPPISPGPMFMPYIDPTQNHVWLPPSIPVSHTPLGYPYISHSPVQPQVYHPPSHPYAVSQPYYGLHNPPHPQQNIIVPVDSDVGSAPYAPRPSSAGPVTSASQAPQRMISGLPLLLPTTSLLPLHDLNHLQPEVAAEPFQPELGKGERASRVAQHLRLSSRNRSVSPQSHRYPLPAPLAVNESYVQDTSSIDATAGVPSNAIFIPRQLPNPPSPPGLLRPENFSMSPPAVEGVVHSPRPQLTPKHSFTRDPVLGAMSKSERVEELEKMADEVARKSRDLSCDLPKGIGDVLAANAAKGKGKEQQSSETSLGESGANVNKTLPGPPVPSGKNILAPPSRARADFYFAKHDLTIAETAPLPSDQTPPTPALLAVLPSRRTDGIGVKAENGLDALERRLLAEVGTRKLDTRHATKDQRPDMRSILPIDTDLSSPRRPSIPIPVKSPEPLHDSAISSLTLAGGLAGDESDGEFDGRTHKAGRSRGGSSDERQGLNTAGLHQHMRARAQGGTPTKMLDRAREWEQDSPEELEKGKEKEKSKEGKTSGKKKDRSSNKSAAKGRVAAWLGRIDPDVPPQEQIIPPSPSVMRNVPSPFEITDNNHSDEPFSSSAPILEALPSTSREPEPQKDVSASPNPRSSGFVPIATLKRDTIQARPLIARDATVVEEARRVQNIWSSENTPVIQANPMPQFLKDNPPATPSMSIRTDRRVLPPSAKPPPPDPRSKPLSYSAAARNGWKQPEITKTPAVLPPPPSKTPVPTPPKNVQQSGRIQSVFPPPKHVDPEVKYDIRSARGGRGGKVTSVTNLWSSGAINNHDSKGKEVPRRLNPVVETSSLLPSQPFRTERKSFSAAVMTPPKHVSVASGSGLNATRPVEAQKRPDSRGVFPESKPDFNPLPKKISSTKTFVPPTTRFGGIHVGKGSQSTDALIQKRPATSMSNPYSLHRKITPNSLSTPSSSEPKLHNLVAKGGRPVIKGTFDPAVVSSSHATPTLSSTASLARPQSLGTQKHPIPVKLPTLSSAPTVTSAEAPRPVSPSKPADLAFGQARLRDLIKKYQGQGQKT